MAAYLIDYVIVNVIVIMASGVIGLTIGLTVGWIAAQHGEQATLPHFIGLVGAVIALTIVLVYYIKFNSSGWQATPGKRMLGIHLITATANRSAVGSPSAAISPIWSPLCRFGSASCGLVGMKRRRLSRHDLRHARHLRKTLTPFHVLRSGAQPADSKASMSCKSSMKAVTP